jgi:phage gp29-like protein
MVQTTETGATKPVPIEKALLFRTNTARGNPEGRSLIRNAYRPHFFKKRIEEIEAVGIERDLAGLPVAFMDPAYLSSAASPAEKQVMEAVQSIVRGIKRNEMEGVIFPLAYDQAGNKIMDLQLLSSGGSRQFDTDKIVARYNQQIAMSVLADFLLLGHEGVGSQALGASKIDLWMMAVEALALAIAETVNNHAIPRLLKLNGMDTEECPKLVFGQVDHIDLGILGTFIKSMTDAGVITPDPTLEDFIRETASLPPADEPDEQEDTGLGAGMSPEDMAAMLAAQQAPPPGKPGGPPVAADVIPGPGGDAGAGALPAAA